MSTAAGEERRAYGMRVSERKTITPVGLSRFLVTHREHEGFETLRDNSLVTVICSGCEASFSYLKPTQEDETPAVIDEQLARITGGVRDPQPGTNGSRQRELDAPLAVPSPASNGPRRRAWPTPPERPPEPPEASQPADGPNGNMVEPPVSPAERIHEPHPFRRLGRPRRAITARRVPPPGPHAPRRRRNLSVAERTVVPLRSAWRRALAWIAPRRRTIALTALVIAGAYVFIALSTGDDASSSSSPPNTPSSDPAIEQSAPMTIAGGFAVVMPPDWTREVNADGSTVLSADGGGGSVTVIAQPRGTATYAQMTQEAAAYIAGGVEPGTAVAQPAWRWVGNLLSVAIASEPDGHNEIAYIGVTPDTRYLVIRSIEPAASALVRLQADGIVTSLTAQ